jgi:hypothetical protein
MNMNEKYEFFREEARFIFEDDVPHETRLEILDILCENEDLSQAIFNLIRTEIMITLVKNYHYSSLRRIKHGNQS